MSQNIQESPFLITPEYHIICVCLGSDMLGCRTCEGVGIMRHRHAFEQQKEFKDKRDRLWRAMRKLGITQKDVYISDYTSIKLRHRPTDICTESINGSGGTDNLIRAAIKLVKKLQELSQ